MLEIGRNSVEAFDHAEDQRLEEQDDVHGMIEFSMLKEVGIIAGEYLQTCR